VSTGNRKLLPTLAPSEILQSATLRLDIKRSFGDEIQVQTINRSWVEGNSTGGANGSGATWNTYDGVNNWINSDSIFHGSSPVTTVGPIVGVADTGADTAVNLDVDVTAAVQGMIDGSLSNHGFHIIPLTFAAGTHTHFWSNESTPVGTSGPQLILDIIPEPGTAMLLLAGALVLDQVRRWGK